MCSCSLLLKWSFVSFILAIPINLSPPRLSSVSVFRVDEPTAVNRLMEWSVRLLQWERSSFVKWGMWRITRRRVESLMSRPASRKHCMVRNWLRLSQPGTEGFREKSVSLQKSLMRKRGKTEVKWEERQEDIYWIKWSCKCSNQSVASEATLSSPGGVTRSLIWASLTPSAYRRSRERRRGQPEEQRAEIDDQEQPATIRSFSPAKSRQGLCLMYVLEHKNEFRIHFKSLKMAN